MPFDLLLVAIDSAFLARLLGAARRDEATATPPS
jgi:hypothetical protein